MKIVVTDGYTVNSGDLSWDRLSSFGDLEVYDRTPGSMVQERCKDAMIIVTNKTPVTKEVIDQLPQLKCISVLATGYNNIDVSAASENGVVVCNAPGYGTASVAQHTFALLLELTNAVGRHSRSVKNGEWQTSADWAYTLQPIRELSGKTIGIVGFGNIGRQVARMAAAFDMRVLYYNPSPKPSELGEQTSLDSLFRESDIVSLHCPLTADNKHLVNAERLTQMKPSAILINTARGPLVNEPDLAFALNYGVIAGAALDVLENEPPLEKQLSLIQAPNCIVTPHNAWMSREARERMMDITCNNIEAFLKGEPVNRVN